MCNLSRIVVSLVIIAGVADSSHAQLTDPYEILDRHYEAIGGIERLRSQTTSYTEGSIDIVGSGLAGPLRQWSRHPELQRVEIELGPLAITQGNNGDVVWSVDQNGKLQVHRDDLTVQQKQVDSLMAELAHLDRDSKIFTLRFDGIDTAAGFDCYVITIANSISSDTTRQYFDTTSFYQLKSTVIAPSGETQTVFSDFRTVEGVVIPFAQQQKSLSVGMVQEIAFTKHEVNVAIDPSLFDPPAEDVSDVHFSEGDRAEDIPFQFIENHIYLPVTVNGKERIWVLDSGAEMTVVERRFAEEIGLELQGEITGKGAGNLVDVTFATLPALSIAGRLSVDEQSVAVIDLYWLFQESLGMEVVGILGYDFLSRVVTKIDYANERLSFYTPDSFAYAGLGTVLDLPIGQGKSFEPPIVVDGTFKGKWYLDLGAGGLSFSYPYAEANGLLERPGIEHVSHGAGGSFSVRSVPAATVEFGGYIVHDQLIDIPLAKTPGAFGESTVAGNLGNSLFSHFILYLDYKNEQLIVEPGDDFDHAFPRDNSGMQIRFDRDSHITVLFVAPNTPAADAGLQADDVLLAIDGRDIAEYGGIITVRELLRAAPGTAYDLAIERAGEREDLRLTLRDLYE